MGHPSILFFNNMVQELWDQLLPNVIDNWIEFSEESKNVISKMANFFCKMVLLTFLLNVTLSFIQLRNVSHM